MRNFRRIILLLSVICACAVTGFSAPRSWEQVRQERLHDGRAVLRVSDIEVRSTAGAIIVSTSRPVQVKVFTILGQLISQDNISPGVSQLNLGMHGLFIVKVGDLTCKVAL